MPARLIQSTEAIEVKQLCCLIYGQPGARKSSLAQTADRPFTFAFDPGIYRAYGRKACAMFDCWADVLDLTEDADRLRSGQQIKANGLSGEDADRYGQCVRELVDARTVVIDTLGMCLEKLAEAIIRDNAKHGNRLGGLSLQGYGVLKSQFAAWCAPMRARGQDLVFLCHEKAEKVGDAAYYCPDIVGGSYNTMMNYADVVGYMHFEGGKRVISFDPTDFWMAKSPPCGWATLALTDFGRDGDFLARLLAEAKSSMGRISQASAAVAAQVQQWRDYIAKLASAEDFNGAIANLTELKEPALSQVRKLLWDASAAKGMTWDKTAKKYTAPAGESAA
jgi:hypothetical protein